MGKTNHQTPVVLIRGWGREQRHWERLVQEKNRRGDQRPWFFLDLPGTGNRKNERSPLSIDEIVESCVKKIPQQPCHFLTISLGGMVGMKWAERKPDHIQSLTLINSSTQLSKPWQRLSVLGILQKVKSWPQIEIGFEPIVLQLTSELSRQEKNIWQKKFEKIKPAPASLFLRQVVAASRFKAKFECLHEISEKIMVIQSTKDHLVDPLCSQYLVEKIKTPHHLVHPWGGHDLALDDPHWLFEKLLPFWKSRDDL